MVERTLADQQQVHVGKMRETLELAPECSVLTALLRREVGVVRDQFKHGVDADEDLLLAIDTAQLSQGSPSIRDDLDAMGLDVPCAARSALSDVEQERPIPLVMQVTQLPACRMQCGPIAGDE